MSTLELLAPGPGDDDDRRAALRRPVSAFLDQAPLSVRSANAVDHAVRQLGARTIAQLCTASGDAAVRRFGGNRSWREVVTRLERWLGEWTASDWELDEESTQESLFAPSRRSLPADQPTLPREGDPATVASWGDALGVADLLPEPLRRVLPPSVAHLVPAGVQASLLQILTGTPGPDRLPPQVHRLLRELVGQELVAIAENRRALARREAEHPRVPGAANGDPLVAFHQVMSAARRTHAGTDAPLRGQVLGSVTFLDDPAQLVYEESTGPRHSATFRPLTSTKVQVALKGWREAGVHAVCGGCPSPRTCAHRAAALDAVLDLLERPSLPAHRRLAEYLATAPWSRLLARLDRSLGTLGAPAGGDQRLAWVLTQRIGHGPSLSAVIQRHGARGWSKGANASLTDLVSNTRSIAGPTDTRVIDIIAASVGPWGQSSLSDREHLFRALEALVGATNVYLDGRRDAPAAVRRVGPRVLVHQLDDGSAFCLRFSLEGEPLEAQGLLDQATDRRHIIAVDSPANEVCIARLPAEVALLAEALAVEPATLPPEAVEPVLARLERVQALVPFELPPALLGQLVAPDRRVVCQLSPLGDAGLAVELGFRPLPGARLVAPGEGAQVVFTSREGLRISARRDLEAERAAAHALVERLALPDAARTDTWRFAIADQELALDVVVALRELGQEVVAEWPQDAWRVESARAGELRLRVTQRRDWFGVEGGVEVDGQLVTLGVLLDAVRRRRKYVALGAGRFARIEEALRRRLDAADDTLLLTRGAVELGAAAPEVVAGLVDDPSHLEAIPSFHDLRARRARAAQYTPVLPDGLKATLRPYQRDGFVWLCRLAEAGTGACLADDMGLGKTVQTLAALLERAPRGPALVLAPTSVVPNWLAEAERFAPRLRRVLYRGMDRGRLLAGLGPYDLLVTSYAIAARDVETLAAVQFTSLVIDEAQALKNAQAQRTHAVRALKADWRLALTGTPIENHLGELWSLFRVVSPALLGGWEHFRERFAAPIERHRDPERQRALSELMRPFLLRRTKQEVAPELPGKTDITRLVDLSPAERQLYDATRAATVAALTRTLPASASEDGKRRFAILAALTRLRLLACHPRLFDESSPASSSKLRALLELVDTLRETGHRALVFSQFVRFLELVRDALEAAGVKVLVLHGGTPAAQRATLIEQFQRGQADVFLISLKAGGTGLNLTEADTVIHLDPWWNPAVEDQATDRTHRIGQRRPVTVVRLVARGTVEEAVIGLHAEKRALARAVLEGADGGVRLDTSDLLALLDAGAPDGAWDAGSEDASTIEPPSRDDERAHHDDAREALDLAALDTLIERAMAPLEASGPSPTSNHYRRALSRFREFVGTGHATHAPSWDAAGDLFLAALRSGSWPAPASFYLTARTSLRHLQRAARPG